MVLKFNLVKLNIIIYRILHYRMLKSWIVMWVPKIRKMFLFNCVRGIFTVAVVLLS